MAAQTKTMHQIRQILDLHHRGHGSKKIVKLTGTARNTVRTYLRDAKATGLSFEALLALDDAALTALLHGDTAPCNTLDPRWADLEGRLVGYMRELKRTGVTKQLLWEEYRQSGPPNGGYRYTQFSYYLRQHAARQGAVMHFNHRPGEQLMIDYTGDKMHWVDPATGERHDAEVLVLTLPFSGLTYAEALPSQRQEDLMAGIVRGLSFIGGVPLSLKFDNLKAAVTRPNRYEPLFTEALDQLGAHYNCTALAARPYKPRDKAHVENGVNNVYRRIFAPLRDREFTSLEALNAAIGQQLERHNTLNFQGKDFSRRDLFEREERATLRPLPPTPFIQPHVTWSKVQKNYHVILGEDRHQYSVPFELIGKRLKLIYTTESVEVYDALTRVAVHRRDRRAHAYTTLAEHMPPNHRHMAARQGWNAEYFLAKAAQIGPATRQVVQKVLTAKVFYEQTYNSCLGILKLAQRYSPERLEAAAARVLSSGATTVNYTLLANILGNNLDQAALPGTAPAPGTPPAHENVRGPTVYQ